MVANEFFTWSVLGTYAGAVLFTTLITQLFKGLGFLDKVPTRIFSYAVAAIILLMATLFTGDNPSLADYVLCLVNAVIVALAANGAFDAVNSSML